ncbi:hypothetical protein [Asticcacaulis sp. AND118]|uniref:hypothetical protein n=1 Tax=Asticcacaulis sp. AND118 TaxID=2840468 RepID=UPI001CFF929F|nr:hypothetical protein [Asticcacaulis sp. AND118]UDF05214.1 hypothetical protein LH365_17645 [Asticcacaulis sp. AND118]
MTSKHETRHAGDVTGSKLGVQLAGQNSGDNSPNVTFVQGLIDLRQFHERKARVLFRMAGAAETAEDRRVITGQAQVHLAAARTVAIGGAF